MAKIHIAKKALGLDDDTYRAILEQVAGVRSARNLSSRGVDAVLAHFEACGWKPTTKGKHRREAPKNFGTAGERGELLKTVEAQLATDGLPWSYAQGIAQQMYRRERLEWCEPAELHAIIASLWKRKRRQQQARLATLGLDLSDDGDRKVVQEAAEACALPSDLRRLSESDFERVLATLAEWQARRG